MMSRACAPSALISVRLFLISGRMIVRKACRNVSLVQYPPLVGTNRREVVVASCKIDGTVLEGSMTMEVWDEPSPQMWRRSCVLLSWVGGGRNGGVVVWATQTSALDPSPTVSDVSSRLEIREG